MVATNEEKEEEKRRHFLEQAEWHLSRMVDEISMTSYLLDKYIATEDQEHKQEMLEAAKYRDSLIDMEGMSVHTFLQRANSPTTSIEFLLTLTNKIIDLLKKEENDKSIIEIAELHKMVTDEMLRVHMMGHVA